MADRPPIDRVVATARELLASVTFDSDGVMVGMVRQGGNGGLLSSKSIRAADQLRLALEALDSARPAVPTCSFCGEPHAGRLPCRHCGEPDIPDEFDF